VEEGQNTSTVALRDVTDDRKGTQSQMRQWDMGTSPAGLGPESDSAGKVQ
jgi:hypothetical protein